VRNSSFNVVSSAGNEDGDRAVPDNMNGLRYGVRGGDDDLMVDAALRDLRAQHDGQDALDPGSCDEDRGFGDVDDLVCEGVLVLTAVVDERERASARHPDDFLLGDEAQGLVGDEVFPAGAPRRNRQMAFLRLNRLDAAR
jgi:hypothetical protein